MLQLNRPQWLSPVLAVILGLAFLALLIDPIHFGDTLAHPVRPSNGDRYKTLGEGPFKLNRVNPNTEGHQRPQEVDSRGCWSESPRAFGTHVTGWYDAKAPFILVVSGFPTAPGNRLEVEFDLGGGATALTAFGATDPQNTWEPWAIAVPRAAVRFRVRAVNAIGGPQGWFAFTEPFTIRMPFDWQLLADFQLLCTTALALALIGGPCLVAFVRYGRGEIERLAYCILVGPLVMAMVGGLCWALGGVAAPALIARVGVAALLLWLGTELLAHRTASPGKFSALAATIAVGILAVGLGVSKANISIGAPGELYTGSISRSLEVGSISDSRISYHAVQLVAHHFSPFGPESAGYYGSWSYAARGPLPGLIAAPILLSTGAAVPTDMPDQPWRPFDRQGFASYRIAMMVLASLAGWALFAVTATLTAPRWGMLAIAIAGLTPFFIHETYFTWPKLIASGTSLVSFLLVYRRRPIWAGLYLGIGYLFHPLVLLMAPFLVLACTGAVSDRPTPFAKRLVPPCLFGLGLLCCLAPWQVVGRWAASGGAQAVFFSYFTGADGQPATWATWWSSRWQSLANTVLPFHLLTADQAHDSLNSVYAPSPWWVRAGFLYWHTLPFALGLPAFALLIAAIIRRTIASPLAAALWFYGPVLFFVAYWGVSVTGVMRACGQPLFIALIVLGVWSIAHDDERWRRKVLRLFLHPICFLWRAGEVAVMAFATTVLNGFPHWNSVFAMNDLLSLFTGLLCIGGIVAALLSQSPSYER